MSVDDGSMMQMRREFDSRIENLVQKYREEHHTITRHYTDCLIKNIQEPKIPGSIISKIELFEKGSEKTQEGKPEFISERQVQIQNTIEKKVYKLKNTFENSQAHTFKRDSEEKENLDVLEPVAKKIEKLEKCNQRPNISGKDTLNIFVPDGKVRELRDIFEKSKQHTPSKYKTQTESKFQTNFRNIQNFFERRVAEISKTCEFIEGSQTQSSTAYNVTNAPKFDEHTKETEVNEQNNQKNELETNLASENKHTLVSNVIEEKSESLEKLSDSPSKTHKEEEPEKSNNVQPTISEEVNEEPKKSTDLQHSIPEQVHEKCEKSSEMIISEESNNLVEENKYSLKKDEDLDIPKEDIPTSSLTFYSESTKQIEETPVDEFCNKEDVQDQLCSTFTHDKNVEPLPNLSQISIDPLFDEKCKKIDNYIDLINEDANMLTSYLNNFEVANSRELYLSGLKKKLSVQQLILEQLNQLEKCAISSKKSNVLPEQSNYFLYLLYKTTTNVKHLEKHINFCLNEQNPSKTLMKGNGNLSIYGLKIGLNQRFISPNHLLTGFFEYQGTVYMLMPVFVNSSGQPSCEFLQKFTFSDLPPNFRINLTIAELPLMTKKLSKQAKKNKIVSKVKRKMTNLLKSAAKSSIKTKLPAARHFNEFATIEISKDNLNQANFTLSALKPSQNLLINGKLALNASLKYNLDIEFSGEVSVLRCDPLGSRIWIQNLLSLKNGKLFFWRKSSNQQLDTVEIIDLADCEFFSNEGTEFTDRPLVLYLRISRFWTAADSSNALQVICGSTLIRHLNIAVESEEEFSNWSRVLKVVVESHQQWKNPVA